MATTKTNIIDEDSILTNIKTKIKAWETACLPTDKIVNSEGSRCIGVAGVSITTTTTTDIV